MVTVDFSVQEHPESLNGDGKILSSILMWEFVVLVFALKMYAIVVLFFYVLSHIHIALQLF